MSNGRLQLEPSDAGSCSRVGNTKRWTQTSTGKSVTELVMVSLDLERAYGALRGGIRASAVCNQPWQGGSHAAWRTLRRDRAYLCLEDGLRRCTGLGASQGAVQGAGRLWAAEGRWEGCSTIQ